MPFMANGAQQYRMPPIKRCSMMEFKKLFQTRGEDLMRHCGISAGEERVLCPAWQKPDDVVVSGLHCQVVYDPEGFRIFRRFDGGCTNIAMGQIWLAENEKDNRAHVFTQLSFNSMPLDFLSRSIVVVQTNVGTIYLVCLAKCFLLHKNLTIVIEGPNGRDVADAMFRSGHIGGACDMQSNRSVVCPAKVNESKPKKE